jgi:hypothetical protein
MVVVRAPMPVPEDGRLVRFSGHSPLLSAVADNRSMPACRYAVAASQCFAGMI